MKILLTLLFTVGMATAFTVPIQQQHWSPILSAVSAELEDTFYRAVHLAEQGEKQIDLDELDRLATALEKVKGCQFEHDSGFCDKEVQDRLDVAEILRMQIELQLRIDYLKGANLFADDVKKQHDAAAERT